MTTTSHFHIFQYIDGQLQSEPVLGSRANFTSFTVPYHGRHLLDDWVATKSKGLVCSSWTETVFRDPQAGNGRGGWERSFTDVLYEFEKATDAVYAKLKFGGAA